MISTRLACRLAIASALIVPAFAQTDTPPPQPPSANPPAENKQDGPPPPPPPHPPRPPYERGERGERGPRHRPPFAKDDPRFQENLKRWKELPPERRDEVRRRDEKRREQMTKEIDKAVTDAGLTLSEEQKAEFTRRYQQERRKIEEGIREKMEALRAEQVEALSRKLVEEFKSAPAPAKAGD